MEYKPLNKRIKEIFSKIKAVPFISNFLIKIDDIQVRYLKKGQLKNHILIKYLIKDLFLYFVVSFLFFFMIFFVNTILITIEDLLAKSAPFKMVMKMMFYSFPSIIAQSTPYATLVGFLMCLGGMMSNNEILIFRAAGFSFIRLLVPVAVLGLFISIGSFFVNDYLIPLGAIKMKNLQMELAESTPEVELESNSVKNLDNSNLVLGDVEKDTVSNLVLFNTKQSDSDKIIIAGKSTLKNPNIEGVIYELDMSDALVISLNRNDRKKFDILQSGDAKFNVFENSIIGATYQSPREMTTVDLYKDIKRLKKISEGSVIDILRINIWTMEFHNKFALPFGSIFFAFLAFSIALLFGKKNGQTIGLFIGLVICVAYWAMQMTGQLFVQRVGLNPFWCIWVPNFLVGFFGIIFLVRLVQK